MRLFVALLPPPSVADELADAVGPLRRLPDASALRWTARESWHFTLAFLGEVADPVRPELAERLGRAAARHEPCALRLSGGGRFGDRALWAGADGDLTGLAALAGSVRDAARRAGAPPDAEHAFRPHLTLARAQRGHAVSLRPFADALTALHGAAWSADTLHLVSSALPRSGVPGEQPRYTTQESWPLGRPAAHRPEG
ncbi:RNA 2',3'-cyclic phosphodiesterase [Streptomyces sp. NPDC093221]|uniref:RNA 2',3'-cyclic phosphodiesterase n=1 Tax=Streptomyces sp. NPDC093221 TaxID=3366032 RepID=UPI00380D747D